MKLFSLIGSELGDNPVFLHKKQRKKTQNENKKRLKPALATNSTQKRYFWQLF